MLNHEKRMPTDYLRASQLRVTRFTRAFVPDENLVYKAFTDFCRGVGSPFSMRMLNHLYYDGDPRTMPQMDKASYWNKTIEEFLLDYQVEQGLSKFTGLPGVSTSMRSEIALQSFAKFEEHCSAFDRSGALRSLYKGVDAIYIAQRKIAHALERFEVRVEDFGWGNGATASVKRANASFMSKVLDYKGQIPLFVGKLIIEEMPDSFLASFFGVDYEKISRDLTIWQSPCVDDHAVVDVVPKNAKTDRTIAIEPTFRMFVQKALGAALRRCLRNVGVNLNDQGRNQELSRLAYTHDLATLDLRAASDTVSRSLILELIPIDIFLLLDAARSKTFVFRGDPSTVHRFKKFSTMGNGFTFELESLIFWAIASTACDITRSDNKFVSVFGDDIIVPQSAAEACSSILTQLGFVINTDKSFTAGEFFESCGKHYFRGFDVTPFYQKEIPTDVEGIYRMANRVRRAAYRSGPSGFPHPSFHKCWKSVCRGLKFDSIHVQSLAAEGDGGLALPWSTLRTSGICRPAIGHGGFYTMHLVSTSSARLPKEGVYDDGLVCWLLLKERSPSVSLDSLPVVVKNVSPEMFSDGRVRSTFNVLGDQSLGLNPWGSDLRRPRTKWVWDDRYFESVW